MQKNDNYRITFTEEGLKFWEEVKRNSPVESPKTSPRTQPIMSPGRNYARLQAFQTQYERIQQKIQKKIESKKAIDMIKSEERMQSINEQYMNSKRDALNSIKWVKQSSLANSNKFKEQLELYHKEKYVKHWKRMKY